MDKYYVSMIDTFMSGWGKAKSRKNVLIFECDTLEEADIVADNAKNRSDQNRITIHKEYPEFLPASWYYVQHKDKHVYPAWYQKGFFNYKEAK